MDALLHDIRFSLRQMARAPLFTAIVIAVLSLGIGVGSAALSYVRGLQTVPAPGVAPNSRLVYVVALDAESRSTFNNMPLSEVSYANFIRLRESVNAFTMLAGQSGRTLPVDAGNGAEAMAVTGVTADYFTALGLQPALGTLRLQHTDSDAGAEPIAVISHRLWQTRFAGAADVVGRAVAINGVPFTVAGVAPAEFGGLYTAFSSPRTHVWVPLAALRLASIDTQSAAASSDSLSLRFLVGIRREGVTDAAAEANAAQAVALTLRSAERPANTLSARVSRARIGDPLLGDSDAKFTALVLSVGAILVLIIACTNVSALLLGRSASRRHEVAVRFSLGASRVRVVRQLLTESAFIATIAGGLGLLILSWIRRLMTSIPGEGTPVVLPVDWSTVLLALGCAALTGVVFGLSPALHASRMSLSEAMKHSGGGGERRRARAQRAMIVAQLAASQPLLLVAMLLVGMVASQRPWAATFDDGDRVLGIGLDFGARDYGAARADTLMRTLRQRLSEHPIVERTEVATKIPSAFHESSSSQSIMPLRPEAANDSTPVIMKGSRLDNSEIFRIGHDYFATIGLPILRGRAFEASDTLPGANNVIVPENVAAAFWPGQDPIGKRLVSESAPAPGGGIMMFPRGSRAASAWTVVGVSRTERAILPEARPLVYMPGGTTSRQSTILLVRTRGPAAPAGPIVQRELARLDPQLPIIELATLQQASRATRRAAAKVSGVAIGIALIALSLVSLGLGGIILYAIGQRVPEIGIRMALGARAREIVGMFVGQGLRTAVIGAVLGIPLSVVVFVAASRLVFGASLTVNTSATIAAAIVLVLVVLLASWIPARRAATVDPLIALRAE